MKSKILATMLMAMPFSAASAAAQKYFVAFDGGISLVTGVCNTAPPNATVTCGENPKAMRLAAGYQLTPTWGVELAYTHFAATGTNGTITTTSPGGTVTAPYSSFVRIRGALLAGVAMVPLGEGWTLITKGGTLRLSDINVLVERPGSTGNYTIHAGATGVALYWAMGAQYDLSDVFALRTQYEDFGSVGDNNTGKFGLRLLTVGLLYRF